VLKNVLKVLAAIPVVIGLFVLIGGLLSRSSWSVQSQIEIAAPPEAVFHYIGDLQTWPGWSAWSAEADATVRWASEPGRPASGVGQVQTWEGERMGSGRRELLEADPLRGIRYRELSNRFEGEGRIQLERIAGGTRVTWSHSGDVGNNLPARLFVKAFEKEALAPALERSLAKLKPLVETLQPAQLDPDPSTVDAPPAPPPGHHDHGLLGHDDEEDGPHEH